VSIRDEYSPFEASVEAWVLSSRSGGVFGIAGGLKGAARPGTGGSCFESFALVGFACVGHRIQSLARWFGDVLAMRPTAIDGGGCKRHRRETSGLN
jgi:hypothetical protein